ncbi:MAG TPA: uridylate kinase [Methylococcaceae bacterium]|nr:uridylate kinase [Methylococcaceae bacterium]
MKVVKLGGSLASGSHLRPWLAALAEHGPGRVALVPGGGPFADAVRASQKVWDFSDRSAHRMALLGMRQFGLMLCGLEPALTEAPGAAAVKKTLEEGGLPVWLPDEEELDAAGVPSSWDITSDSLAAWLAGRVGAEELLLVKSCPVGEGATLESLVGDGIIDPALPDFLRCPLRVVAATESLGYAALLDR